MFAYTSVGFFTNATLVRLAAGIVAVYLINTTIFKYKGRRRAMSTSSAVMAMGGFPVASRMPDPIINIYLYFDVLPSMESLKTLAREHMIRFERFHSIPVPGENDTHVWQPVRVHVDDHFTEHEAKDAADVDQIAQKIVDGPLRYPLGPRWEFHLISNESAPATVSSSNSSTSSSPSSSSSGDNESKSSSASTVKQPKNRHLLIVRIDHSIGDGIALVAIFNRLLCDEKGRPLSETQKDFVRKDSDKLVSLVVPIGRDCCLSFVYAVSFVLRVTCVNDFGFLILITILCPELPFFLPFLFYHLHVHHLHLHLPSPFLFLFL